MLAAMFGRPERGTALERERADDLNPMHVQFLTNSSAIEDTIYNCPRIQRVLKDKTSDAEIVEEPSCTASQARRPTGTSSPRPSAANIPARRALTALASMVCGLASDAD